MQEVDELIPADDSVVRAQEQVAVGPQIVADLEIEVSGPNDDDCGRIAELQAQPKGSSVRKGAQGGYREQDQGDAENLGQLVHEGSSSGIR